MTDRPPQRTFPAASRTRGFYGWRMVAFAGACLAMTAPGQTVGVSVFVDPMIASLDLSRSQVSLAYLVGTLAGATTLPTVGQRIDRWGVRRVTTLIAVGFGVVLAAMSQVSSMATLLLGFFGIRMLGQGALGLTATTSVALWFERRRGLAIGLSTAGGQSLMSLAPLALAAAIAAVGWRGAWVLAAAAVWLVVVPIARWGLQDSPAAIGQHLDGDAPDDARPRATQESWTRAEAVRTGMFWVVTAAVATAGMIGTGLAFHQISLLGERGLTVAQAAANFVPQTLAGIGATVAAGLLVDRIAPRMLISASMAGLAAAMLLAQHAAPGWRAVAFGIAAGASGGALRAVEAAAFPRYFGLGHVGTIRGLVMSLNVGATALGPLALAVGHDLAGSYGPALTVLLPIPAAVALASLVTAVPDQRTLAVVRARIVGGNDPN